MDEVYFRDTLSQYELATLAAEQLALAGNSVALFLTVTSGYLVAAYFGAGKLEGKQITLLNLLYVFSSVYFAFGFISTMAQSAAYEWLIPRPKFAEIVAILFLAYSCTLFFLMLLSIPACIRFMSKMREQNDESGDT